MKIAFQHKDLERLYTDAGFDAGLPGAVVKKYRAAVQFISRARDENDIRAMKSFNFKKLKGDRNHRHQVRLNDQYGLVVEIDGKGADKSILVISVGDPH